jgi:hypothetical protein
MLASKPRRSPLLREQVSAQSTEPPYTDPYVRWCGRGGAARLPPIPIFDPKLSSVGAAISQRHQSGYEIAEAIDALIGANYPLGDVWAMVPRQIAWARLPPVASHKR